MDVLPLCGGQRHLCCCVLGRRHRQRWSKQTENKFVSKAISVVGMELDSVEVETERRMRGELKAIMTKPPLPLYAEPRTLRGAFSHRLIQPRASKSLVLLVMLYVTVRWFFCATESHSLYKPCLPHHWLHWDKLWAGPCNCCSFLPVSLSTHSVCTWHSLLSPEHLLWHAWAAMRRADSRDLLCTWTQL